MCTHYFIWSYGFFRFFCHTYSKYVLFSTIQRKAALGWEILSTQAQVWFLLPYTLTMIVRGTTLISVHCRGTVTCAADGTENESSICHHKYVVLLDTTHDIHCVQHLKFLLPLFNPLFVCHHSCDWKKVMQKTTNSVVEILRILRFCSVCNFFVRMGDVQLP